MYKQHRLIGLECGELSGSIINQKEEEEEEDSVRPAKRFTTKKKINVENGSTATSSGQCVNYARADQGHSRSVFQQVGEILHFKTFLFNVKKTNKQNRRKHSLVYI